MNIYSIENALSALAALMPKADLSLVEEIAQGAASSTESICTKQKATAAVSKSKSLMA